MFISMKLTKVSPKISLPSYSTSPTHQPLPIIKKKERPKIGKNIYFVVERTILLPIYFQSASDLHTI